MIISTTHLHWDMNVTTKNNTTSITINLVYINNEVTYHKSTKIHNNMIRRMH